MNRVSKCIFVAAASVAMTNVAFAQDPPADPPADGTGATVSGDAAVTVNPDGTPVVAVDVNAGAMLSVANWPTSYLLRTLNAAKGMLEVGAFLNIGLVKTANTAGEEETETIIGLNFEGRYGINEKLEALFAYTGSPFLGGLGNGITLSPDSEFKGAVVVGAGYQAVAGGSGGKLDIEPKGALSYDLLGETAVLLAGADVRFKLNDKIWIGTPQNRPGLVVTLKGIEAGPVTISPIFFDLPLGVGFQASDKLHLQLNTQLLRLAINEDAGDSAFFAADFIPLDLEALFAVSNKLDVKFRLNFGELKDSAGDFIGVSAGAFFRI